MRLEEGRVDHLAIFYKLTVTITEMDYITELITDIFNQFTVTEAKILKIIIPVLT